jgi:hypothetical protein
MRNSILDDAFVRTAIAAANPAFFLPLLGANRTRLEHATSFIFSITVRLRGIRRPFGRPGLRMG